MSEREECDSDAPEELTAEQGIQQDEEITRIKKENKARAVREAKEIRRKLAKRKTPRPSKGGESIQDVPETETETDKDGTSGMLPSDIVQLIAAREKKVFLSDSEDEKAEAKPLPKKKKPKNSGINTVVLKDTSPPQCLQSSLEFLKKKKMRLSRSSAVLNNSNQVLRLISASGVLSRK